MNLSKVAVVAAVLSLAACSSSQDEAKRPISSTTSSTLPASSSSVATSSTAVVDGGSSSTSPSTTVVLPDVPDGAAMVRGINCEIPGVITGTIVAYLDRDWWQHYDDSGVLMYEDTYQNGRPTTFAEAREMFCTLGT